MQFSRPGKHLISYATYALKAGAPFSQSSTPGLRSRKDLEILGRSRSRIPKNTRGRICLFDSETGSPIELFLHRTPKLENS